VSAHVEYTFCDTALPSRAELPPRVRDLLPAWDRPGTLCTVANFDGYFVAANARYLHVLGWSTAERMCAPYWDFVHPDDRHALVESVDRLLTVGDVLVGYDVRRLCRDGSFRWIRWDMLADPATELLYGVGVDVTDQKPPTAGVRVSVGTWVRDVEDRRVAWSDELYGMYGLPVGTPLTDAVILSRIHPQDHPLVDGAWRASLADTDSHTARFRALRPDGTVRYLESTGRVTARSGPRPITVRGITIDVTDIG
jgi:PAS domain S-box-containing protein